MTPHRISGQQRHRKASPVELNPVFVRPGESSEVPRMRIPRDESLPETAYQIVHDEAMLDGNARLNLATSSAPGWRTRPIASTWRLPTRT
ncbi:MAG: hypothetical protein SOH99_04840 [Acidipropionibacterium acidipropionici]|jgi:glutamate decarboxylase|uniref:hypothetical protein n=1 Tax=Acidipropionibacterium acidipropionici TaxID=1748 RepID=UPI002F3561CD